MDTLVRITVAALVIGSASTAGAKTHGTTATYGAYEAMAPAPQTNAYGAYQHVPFASDDDRSTATGGPSGGLPNAN